jgi:hypothetical protein
MSYMLDAARLLTAQLEKFATLRPHQLAGQVANLDFWRDEVQHAITLLDAYPQRFKHLRDAQVDYVQSHRTTNFNPGRPDEISAVPPLKGIPDTERSAARKSLTDAYYQFLLRCFRERVISEETLRSKLNDLDMSVDPFDLR